MPNYCIVSAGTGSSTAAITNGVWLQWASTTATNAATNVLVEWDTGTTAVTNAVWVKWTDTAGNEIGRTQYAPYQYQPPAPPTEEELQRERQRRLEAEERCKEAEAKKKAADERAEELLKQLLSKEQRRQFKKDKSFTVTGADGHVYRIRHGWSGHVDRLDKQGEKPVERFCIHPHDYIPVADNQLVAKLMLETNPAEFRRKANVTQLA